MTKRFVVEGTWSGYTSAQRRVCHRQVILKWKADKLSKVVAIIFSDGTTMDISVRPATFREKVKEIHGYDSLLLGVLGKEGHVNVSEIKV